MYEIPRAGQIAHTALVKQPYPYEYHPSSKNPGLWTHKILPINFTLIVNDFGVKYLGKDHALHLKAALEDKYKINKDWKGGLYIGIALNWDYEKGTVQRPIPGYVHAAIHSFQHEKTKIPQDSL